MTPSITQLCFVSCYILHLRSAVISYCNKQNSVVQNINWGRKFRFAQLLIPVLQIHSCTTCFGLFTCYLLQLWSAILILHIVCVKCDLKMAQCEQTETCLFLCINDAGITVVKMKFSAVPCHSSCSNSQQPVTLIVVLCYLHNASCLFVSHCLWHIWSLLVWRVHPSTTLQYSITHLIILIVHPITATTDSTNWQLPFNPFLFNHIRRFVSPATSFP
jgi:hypothetical protein